MGQPYIAEIRIFGGNFAPDGWAFCDGAVLAISEYSALFSLIGTYYGGDGQQTFALPDLRGRVPLHNGNGFTLAQIGGVESVQLSSSQIPSHNHLTQASSSGQVQSPSGAVALAQAASAQAGVAVFGPSAGASNVALNTASVGQTGGSTAHSNIQPYLAVNFIMSLFGVYPSQV